MKRWFTESSVNPHIRPQNNFPPSIVTEYIYIILFHLLLLWRVPVFSGLLSASAAHASRIFKEAIDAKVVEREIILVGV